MATAYVVITSPQDGFLCFDKRHVEPMLCGNYEIERFDEIAALRAALEHGRPGEYVLARPRSITRRLRFKIRVLLLRLAAWVWPEEDYRLRIVEVR